LYYCLVESGGNIWGSIFAVEDLFNLGPGGAGLL
jgi:hypothetical protein